MSKQEFKPGDRVKFTYIAEGIAEVRKNQVNQVLCISVTPNHTVFLSSPNLSVEIIEPEIVLPTTPGAVVQIDPKDEHSERFSLTLESDGLWWSGDGAFTRTDIVSQCRMYGYRVWEAAE